MCKLVCFREISNFFPSFLDISDLHASDFEGMLMKGEGAALLMYKCHRLLKVLRLLSRHAEVIFGTFYEVLWKISLLLLGRKLQEHARGVVEGSLSHSRDRFFLKRVRK